MKLRVILLVYKAIGLMRITYRIREYREVQNQGIGASRGGSGEVEATRSVLSQKPREGCVSRSGSDQLCKCCLETEPDED